MNSLSLSAVKNGRRLSFVVTREYYNFSPTPKFCFFLWLVNGFLHSEGERDNMVICNIEEYVSLLLLIYRLLHNKKTQKPTNNNKRQNKFHCPVMEFSFVLIRHPLRFIIPLLLYIYISMLDGSFHKASHFSTSHLFCSKTVFVGARAKRPYINPEPRRNGRKRTPSHIIILIDHDTGMRDPAVMLRDQSNVS